MQEPVEFISVAEETGLIVPIGWWVLREASRQMLGQFPEYSSLTINVNFSGIQFVQTDVVQKIDEILHSANFACLKSQKPQLWKIRLCCNSCLRTNAPSIFRIRLRSNSKNFDAFCLSLNVSFFYSRSLSFSNHIHCLVTA